MNKRASGVLMHVSSLPGAYGIGCFGKEAKEFIDFLSDTGCTYWQVLRSRRPTRTIRRMHAFRRLRATAISSTSSNCATRAY